VYYYNNTTGKEFKMKSMLLAGVAAIVVALPAHANSVNARITDKYETVTKRIPHTEQICRTVDVPIYGNVGGGASGADVLGGMILGGLIGKGATGKDNGAAAGAVIGGMIAADKGQKQGVVGYRQETRCENQTTYTTKTEEMYSHSVITWTENGQTYSLRFQR
jgi:uncharacterized protein YcfJ